MDDRLYRPCIRLGAFGGFIGAALAIVVLYRHWPEFLFRAALMLLPLGLVTGATVGGTIALVRLRALRGLHWAAAAVASAALLGVAGGILDHFTLGDTRAVFGGAFWVIYGMAVAIPAATLAARAEAPPTEQPT